MKLMLRQYLADLRERDELDAILPALLSETGFNVISEPRRGTRQNGVDVAAVGPDEDDGGRRKVFLFVLKAGDIGRRDWDGGPQSIRPSLNEIQDTYLRNRIPEQFQRLPIAVCLCMGGVLREEVQAQWTGYVEGETREGLCFRMWNGDKLAELLVTGVLRGELLTPDVQSDFEKSVAMVDHPEVAYRFFRRVTSQLLDGTVEDPRGATRLRQMYVALWVLFVWARAAENLEAAFRVSEYALIRMWGYCRGSAMTGVLPTGAGDVADQIIGLHLVISTELLNDKVEPYAKRQFALSAAVDSESAVDVNLALFDLLGRISLAGLWWHWRATFVDDAGQRSVQVAARQADADGDQHDQRKPCVSLPYPGRLRDRTRAFHAARAGVRGGGQCQFLRLHDGEPDPLRGKARARVSDGCRRLSQTHRPPFVDIGGVLHGKHPMEHSVSGTGRLAEQD